MDDINLLSSRFSMALKIVSTSRFSIIFHFLFDLLLSKVLFTSFHGWLDRISSRVPASRTNFTVLLHELECFDQSQCFVDRSTDGQIVDRDLTHSARRIDDEQTPKRDADFLQKHAVILRDALRQVSKEGVIHFAEASFTAWKLGPCEMREMRVDGTSQNFSAEIFELLDAIAEGDDFSRTHKGEVERIEEEYQVLPCVVRQLNLSELTTRCDSLSFEIGSGLCDVGGFVEVANV